MEEPLVHTRGALAVVAASAEDALRLSEERYRRIIETTHEGVCIADPDYRYVFTNRRLEEMLGYGPGELLGMTVFDLMDEAGAVAQRERMLRRREGQPESGELGLRRKDGREIWVMFDSHSIQEDGQYKGVLSMLRDITDRRDMEARLRESESQLREAQKIARLGSWEWDLVTNKLTRSPEYVRMVGLDVDTDRPVHSAIHPEDEARVRESVARAVRDRAPWSCDYRLRVHGKVSQVHGRGTVIVDATGAAARVVGTVQDVTEKKETEARLALSSQMVSLGTLALGVAHQMNNPLASVTANLDLIDAEVRALAEEAPSPRLREIAEMAREARVGAERVGEIVRGLKIFSRGAHEAPVRLDVRRVLDVAIDLTASEVGPRARLVKDYGEIPAVVADEGRLGQVFVNLLMNAAQSFASGLPEENEIRVVTLTSPDGRALVLVRDTGPGISAEAIPRIFDPFFTTKEIGRGTGLGLSVCHGIITALGGELTATSDGPGGSVFSVLLPAAAPDAPAEPVKAPRAAAASGLRARVLVVDDDAMVAKTIGRVLRDHDVTVVTNGRDALDLLLTEKTFDVILCDLMMPVMTGMDLHRALGEKRPELAAIMIFVTGGAFTDETRDFLDHVPNERIEKPFDPRTLRAVVERAARPAP